VAPSAGSGSSTKPNPNPIPMPLPTPYVPETYPNGPENGPMIGPREQNIHDVLYDFREGSWSDNLARFDRWMDQNSYQPDAFDFATAGMGMGPKLGTNLLGRLLGSRWAARLLPAARGAALVDGVVVSAGGSIRQAVTAANSAGLSQAQAVQAITRVTQASGRSVGAVVNQGGAKILTGVVLGAGQPIVSVGANGVARFGSATVNIGVGPGGKVVTTVSNIVIP